MNERQVAAAVERLLGAGGSLAVPLTLAEARSMADQAGKLAGELAIPVIVAVVDAAGSLILVHRMDGALPASLELAINKAFTAAAFRLPTHDLGGLAQPGGPLYGVQSSHQGRVVLFGGGYPIQRGGSVVGAIGVSGGTVEQDMHIAHQVIRNFAEEAGLCPEGGNSHE
jgi:uncharacterized protein GlcG (DUF336 family)